MITKKYHHYLLKQKKNKIIENGELNDAEFEFLIRSLRNRIYLIELMQLPTYQEKHEFRDSIMAENISWIMKEFLPNQKFIIWGADIHISKNAKWEEYGNEWIGNKSMV